MSDKAKSTTALILVLTAWSGLAWAAPQEWSGRGAPPPKVSVPGPSAPAWAGQQFRNRIAIVIGNGSGYAERKLAKPEQDASSMAAMLKGLGFRVYGLVNASREEMDRLVREVTEDAKDLGEVELVFFYSGHGSQIANANYLLPVDLPVGGDDVTIVNRGYALSEVLGRLSQLKGRKVVLLDACRDNPYAKGKGAGSGLAKVGGGPETLIAYATQAGRTATEGSNRLSHSLFTEALLKALADPNRNVTEVLASTITMVHGESEERQLPDYTSNLGENGFYFAPRTCSTAQERKLWVQARATDTEIAYQDFLQTCQGSDKAADASYAIGKLREKRDMQSRLDARQTGQQPTDDNRPQRASAAQATPATKTKPLETDTPREEALSTEVRQTRDRAEGGDSASQNDLGYMYERGLGVPKDDAQAVAWYRKAAEQGSPTGQNNLGIMYANGRGVPKDDAQAVAWYRKAAEQGHPPGQNNLGYMYEKGRGVPKDDAQAVAWYRKAAEQGSPTGQANLGIMYEYGRGIPKDDAQAVAWYRKAAEQGNEFGQYNLGDMYEYGKGVPKDDAQAVAWYRKAAEQGNESAKRRGESLEKKIKAQN